MGNLIIFLLLAGAVGLTIRHIVKNKKKGKNFSCGCNCAECRGGCH